MGLSWPPPSARPSARRRARKVLVVTGGPGVGKTTIVRGILEMFAGQGPALRAVRPTGRAAKRLTETTGREAKTIHRLLEFDPALGGFKRDAAIRSTSICWWWTRRRWWTWC